MASILNATTTSGLVTSADNSGSLQLQTNSGTTAVTIDTSQNVTMAGAQSVAGNLSFNSGYGSSAVAYGCRAWVNFNGTGTVAIRSSGNVSSITDNGTGDYTINFTNALTDTSYATTVTCDGDSKANSARISTTYALGTTSSVRVNFYNSPAGAFQDPAVVCASVFR